MAFFVLRIHTLVFVVATLICGALMLSASKAGAYPGPVNVDGSSGAGYIATSVIGGVASGSCLGCHFGGDVRALFAGLAAISFVARRRKQSRAAPMASDARPTCTG